MNISTNKRFAVVGMGGLFPEADNLSDYWSNIINKKVSIREAPESCLNKEVFYDKTVLNQQDKNEKSYTDLCGLIRDFNPSPQRYRIPPAVWDRMDRDQQAMLIVTDQALAGVSLDNINKEKVAVFVGEASYSNLMLDFDKRLHNKVIMHWLQQQGMAADMINRFGTEFIDAFPRITEDSAPGTLKNIIAARVASVFDFHGPSYTLNSACASGLTAVIRGVDGLRSGEFDAVICGAADMNIATPGFSFFCAINALSPDGAHPFDERANGFVLGQGAGVVIIKRLADAVRDGDTIYALIAGFGQSSDGKGKAIAAPDKQWQCKTIQKSMAMAGYAADTVEYIEAHGTGTKVGDVVETAALKEAFAVAGERAWPFCGLSSVKGNIGHLKSAAGIAGLIKAVLAIYNRILPPTAGFRKLNPALALENSPFYIIDQPREWQARVHPRRAGVSAFGFGGANYHISLEEFRQKDFEEHKVISLQETGTTRTIRSGFTLFFSGQDSNDILRQLDHFTEQAESHSFAELCVSQNYLADAQAPCRLAFRLDSQLGLSARVACFRQHHRENPGLLELQGLYYREGRAVKREETVLLFPGQGSQYADMLLKLKALPAFYRTLERADAIWTREYGYSITSLISSHVRGREETEAILKETEHTHPAVFITSLALYKQLKQQGVQAKYHLGHSLGELTALAAAGVWDETRSLLLAGRRGSAFRQSKGRGSMVAVKLDAESCVEFIKPYRDQVVIANLNSPEQTILSGEEAALAALSQALKARGIKCSTLQVSRAFHSPLVAEAAGLFKNALESSSFNEPETAVGEGRTGELYPADPDQIRERLAEQICAPVDFTGSLRKMYARGARLFIEVGPQGVLSQLTRGTLAEHDVTVLTADYKNRDELGSFSQLICALFACGMDVSPVSGVVKPAVPERETAQDIWASGVLSERSARNAWAGSERRERPAPAIVFSGAAIGLPGSYKDIFAPDNFEQLFRGTNLIEPLNQAEKQEMVDRNISKLNKNESGADFKILASLNEVIQLAGKAGQLDLTRYLINEKDLKLMSSAIGMAVAAGYEALRDARIPLVREYIKTAAGTELPGRWVLPGEMQEETGVIFATGFPMLDPVITEVSRYLAHTLDGKIKEALIGFYESILTRLSDPGVKKLLSDWFTVHYSKLSPQPGEEELYRFNHQFITRISAQANNRLAGYINARGPNFLLSAACSSTSTAVSLAEELIAAGRVKRMIIVGADDPTTTQMLPLIGSGFTATGAATTCGNITEAAVPFDKRRNGMIMGAGAIGLVIESKEEAGQRGIIPVCELLGSHLFNTAGHIARIEHTCFEHGLNKLLATVEAKHGLDRKTIAAGLLYMSHETYTPAKGGCSQTEAVALKAAFGEDYRKILITNTKGMTGHTMGASLEDAVAAKSLQYGKCPPVVNYRVPDQDLAGLNLSRGDTHTCSYALKMAAGFGGQGNYLLLKQLARGEKRIASEPVYTSWLQRISGQSEPVLSDNGHLLVIAGSDRAMAPEPMKAPAAKPDNDNQPAEAAPVLTASGDPVQTVVLKVFAEISGYPEEMLDLGMEIEADLGIDTVKQATILSLLGDQFGVPDQKDFKPADYPTIGHIINFYASSSELPRGPAAPETVIPPADPAPVQAAVLKVFTEISGYPEEMLDLGMEIEADLGIDTVKQATIMSLLGDQFGVPEQKDFKLSEYPTIGHLVNMYNQVNNNSFTTLPDEPCPESPVAGEKGSEEPTGELTRQVLCLTPEPLGKKDTDLTGRKVLLLGSSPRPAGRAAEEVRDQPRKALQQALESLGAVVSFHDLSKATDPDMAADLIIDLSFTWDTIDFILPPEYRRAHDLAGSSRFSFYKHLDSCNLRPGRILCLTFIDGKMGIESNEMANPLCGAVCGFYKALGKEWPETVVKILDLEPRLLAKGAYIDILCTELQYTGSGCEICYAEGKRFIVQVDEAEVNGQRVEYPRDMVYLVTGGAAGITAELLKGLARHWGGRFGIFGRTALPGNIDELCRYPETELNDLKLSIFEQLKQSHSHVTPVMVESEYNRITRAIEIHGNLQELQALGAEVCYIPCDVTDYESLSAGIKKIKEKWGPVRGIIHGAGLELSHRLGKKTLQEFNRVYATKVLSALHLAGLCAGEPLSLVVAMASVSGRFGNAAQLDYSAANNFLSYWVKWMRTRHQDLHSLSLCWSGWSGLGMAWRNEYVRQYSVNQGMGLIEPEAGVRAFLEELSCRSSCSEVILHRGLGPLQAEGVSKEPVAALPLIDRLVKRGGKLRRAYRILTVQRDEFMRQHRLGEIPLMPAVSYLELCCEYDSLVNGPRRQYVFRELNILGPVKLYREESREIFVEGTPVTSGEDYELRLYHRMAPRNSSQYREIPFCILKMSAAPPAITDFEADKWPRLDRRVVSAANDQPGDNLQSLNLEEYFSGKLKAGNSRQVYFGPLYQDIMRGEASPGSREFMTGPRGVVYPITFPREQLGNPGYPLEHLLINPCIIDSLFQGAALYCLTQSTGSFLPCGVQELGIVNIPKVIDDFRVFISYQAQTADEVHCDAIMIDTKERVNFYAKGIRMKRINS